MSPWFGTIRGFVSQPPEITLNRMLPAPATAARQLLSGDEVLDYRLVRSRRRSLTIIVHRDGAVEVRAPLRLAQRDIDAFLAERAEWIRRKQGEFARTPPPPPTEYRDGAAIPFLGESLVLAVATGRARTWSEPGRLCVRVADPSDEALVRERVMTWYRHQAERLMPERLAALWPKLATWRVPYPELRYRWMRSRWGSCSRDAKISLNVQLVKAPLTCIDYVVAHELCHLREFNHSARFYALLTELMPDWEQQRERLNAVGSLRTD